jgi:MFS family permease
MTPEERARLAVYVTYAMQAIGLSISWQFSTYFIKHDLATPDFVIIAVMVAIPGIVTTIAVNLWGSFSDKYELRKPFMIIGFVGYALTFMLYSFVTDSFQFLIVAIIGAFFSSAALPVGQAFLTTSTEKKGERIGFFLIAQSFGWFVGTISSGILYEIIGMVALYRIAASLCIIATLINAIYVSEVPIINNNEIIKGNFKTLVRKPGMLRIFFAYLMSMIGMNALSFLFAIILVDELGGLHIYVGLANATATLIAMLITGYVGKANDRYGPVIIFIASMCGYVLFSLFFALAEDPILATILWVIPIYPLSNTASYSLAAIISGEEERGRAMSLINGAQNAGSAFGPIIGGLFAQFIFLTAKPIAWITFCFSIIGLLLSISLRTLSNLQIGRAETGHIIHSELL